MGFIPWPGIQQIMNGGRALCQTTFFKTGEQRHSQSSASELCGRLKSIWLPCCSALIKFRACSGSLWSQHRESHTMQSVAFLSGGCLHQSVNHTIHSIYVEHRPKKIVYRMFCNVPTTYVFTSETHVCHITYTRTFVNNISSHAISRHCKQPSM